MLDKHKFIKLMTGLCDLYNHTPSEFTYDMYYNIFKDFDYFEIEAATRDCIMQHKYNTLPKPAEILEFLTGTSNDKALRAWMQVLKAIKDVGYYKSVEFSDPAISQCVQHLGGWMWLCSQEIKEMPFVEKRFLESYRTIIKRGDSIGHRLIGFIEAKNRAKGYLQDIPKPVRIGFNQKQIAGKEKKR